MPDVNSRITVRRALQGPIQRPIRQCCGSLALLIVLAASVSVHAGAEAGRTATPAIAAEDLRHAESLSRAFRAVSRAVAPAVVQVTAINRRDGEAGDDSRRGREKIGEGSGVIVNLEGYIVTNHHVAAGADEIQIRTRDGREFAAEVVGLDRESDLAVLKIDGDDLVAAPFGDSAAVEPGDWVVAVGNPYRFDHTVTAGIVSAVRRSNIGLAVFENFIQTDAAINPGNSGGPLLNLRGEIIGINTAISTRSGGYTGIGFAIPSNMARSVLESIVETGRVERGWLGVQIQTLTTGLAESFGYQGPGVLIAEVRDGPARRAGMRAGDIVTQVANRPVTGTADLLNAVGELRPGERAAIDYFREGREDELVVTLGERPYAERAIERRAPRPSPVPELELGLETRTLSIGMAQRIGADDLRGVVIVEVDPGSLAARSGLTPGDVIVEVNSGQVVGVEDFDRTMAEVRLDEPVRLLVWFRGRYRYVLLEG